MRKPHYTKLILLLGISGFMVVQTSQPLQGQYQEKEEKNYGNTPTRQIPYANWQDAYMKHFLEPQAFTGAGREKPEPEGLTEVRLGVLAPLEGNILVPLSPPWSVQGRTQRVGRSRPLHAAGRWILLRAGIRGQSVW